MSKRYRALLLRSPSSSMKFSLAFMCLSCDTIRPSLLWLLLVMVMCRPEDHIDYVGDYEEGGDDDDGDDDNDSDDDDDADDDAGVDNEA